MRAARNAAHFGDHVLVVRRLLHGARLTLHVHEAEAGAARRRRLQRAGLVQRAHVVDDVRAGGHRGAHDFGLAGIDRNENGGLAAQRLDDRNDALQFLRRDPPDSRRDAWIRRRRR